MRGKLIILGLLGATLLTFVFGWSKDESRVKTAAANCDRLAAHPSDPGNPVGIHGVASGKIDTNMAVSECTEAVADEPDNPRYHYQLGRAYLDKTYYSSAFREFSTAAEQGSAIARAELGLLWMQGLGAGPDKAEGLKLLLSAANSGDAIAIHNLGIIYRDGDGVPVDGTKSLAYLRKAMSLGYIRSYAEAGLAYENGLAVAVDYAEAMRLYQIAAKHNAPEALDSIGRLYQEGRGVAQDYRLAMQWYRRAQQLGDARAAIDVAYLLDRGLGTAADAKSAAALAMGALAKNTVQNGAYVSHMLLEATWSPVFWWELQTRLAANGHLKTAVDGTLNDATKAAIAGLIAR